jgi:hypothetical protein
MNKAAKDEVGQINKRIEDIRERKSKLVEERKRRPNSNRQEAHLHANHQDLINYLDLDEKDQEGRFG